MLTALMQIGSETINTGSFKNVQNPYTKEDVSRYCICDIGHAHAALEKAREAKKSAAATPLHKRISWLEDVAQKLQENEEKFAHLITVETGKPIIYAQAEVRRCIETIKLSAYAVLSATGHTIPTDATQSGKQTLAFYTRVPCGVIVAITPFNYPLNLVAHKIAPALVAGNTVVLKPTPEAPMCAYELAKLFIDSTFSTPHALSVVYGDKEIGETLVKSDIPRVISFTGSLGVGKAVMQNAGIKKVSLELGGNAATYIDESADIGLAASKCAVGAFMNSGQICISLQRIYVNEAVCESFTKQFVLETSKLRTGNPFDKQTTIGPLINEDAGKRALSWIQKAKEYGADVLCGGYAENGCLAPTVLTNVTDDMSVVCEEVFAPIVSLIKVSSGKEAFSKINDSIFGLQHSIFTQDITKALAAINELECGGVIVNDMPTLRFDIQPYGGVKQSGVGREGAIYAIEEFTEIKTVIFSS